MQPAGVTIRPAVAGDAASLSALYLEEYTPKGGGDPARHYPFPQFFDPSWIRRAVEGDGPMWYVAETERATIGGISGLPDIGGRGRAAEVFGLVVAKRHRRSGIGSYLLTSLSRRLHETASVIVGEVRTAEAGAWRTVRRAGFRPAGYEPYVHTTPAGSETMLHVFSSIITERLPPQSTRAVNALVSAVLGRSPEDRAERPALEPLPPRQDDPRHLRLTILASTPAEPGIPDGWCSVDAGVARFHGEESRKSPKRRFRREIVIGDIDGTVAGTVCAFEDTVDERVRLSSFMARREYLCLFLSSLVGPPAKAASARPVFYIDVPGGAPELHDALERSGFCPVAYFPALLSGGVARFTHFGRRDLIADCVVDRWEPAGRVRQAVEAEISRRFFCGREREVEGENY